MLHIQFLIKRGNSLIDEIEKSIQILTYISFNGTKILKNKCLSEQVFNQFSFFHRFELIFADFRNDFEKKSC